MSRLIAALMLLALLLTPTVMRADSPFDPAHGDEIAGRVMLAPEDLPGDGWSAQAMIVDVESAAGAVPDTLACNNSLGPMFQAAGKHPDGTVAGTAAETLTRPGPGLLSIPTEVALQVDVHEDDSYLDGAMDRTRDILAGPDLSTCLGDLFSRGIGAGLKATVKDVDPWVAAPNGGIGRAVEVTMGAGVFSISLRMELYVWVYGNAVVQVSALGSTDGVSSDLVSAVVNKTQANLDREAGR